MRIRIAAFLCLAAFAAAVATAGLAAGSGSREYTLSAYGVRFSLPVTWEALGGEASTPTLIAFHKVSASSSDTRLKFFAHVAARGNRSAAVLGVYVVDIPIPITFGQFEEELAFEEHHFPEVKHFRIGTVTLPAAGRAVRIWSEVSVDFGGRRLRFADTRYGFLRHGKRIVIFAFATAPELRARYAPVFATAARSIDFDRR